MTHPAQLREARAQLSSARGLTELQETHRARIDKFLTEHGPLALTRTCIPGHLTASCLLWDAPGERVLLHRHRKLGLWLQFGGHCDGDGDLRGVARRETLEECGIDPMVLTEHPIDFDVHEIPARKGEPAHLHLDVRFLARAPEGAQEAVSEESLELKWWKPEEARALGLDESLLRMLDLGPLC